MSIGASLLELLRLGQMQRARLDRERLDVADMGDPQTVLADGFDVFRPRIDVGHVFAGLHHMRPGITADRPRADDRYLVLRHSVFLRIRSRPSAPRAPSRDPSTARALSSSYRFGGAGLRGRGSRRGCGRGAPRPGLAARFARPSRRFGRQPPVDDHAERDRRQAQRHQAAGDAVEPIDLDHDDDAAPARGRRQRSTGRSWCSASVAAAGARLLIWRPRQDRRQ